MGWGHEIERARVLEAVGPTLAMELFPNSSEAGTRALLAVYYAVHFPVQMPCTYLVALNSTHLHLSLQKSSQVGNLITSPCLAHVMHHRTLNACNMSPVK
jgi:hypothetical protein